MTLRHLSKHLGWWLFSCTGRLNQPQFLIGVLMAGGIFLLVILLNASAVAAKVIGGVALFYISLFFSYLVFSLLVYVFWALIVKRLQDIGLSGYWFFLFLLVVVLAYKFFPKDQADFGASMFLWIISLFPSIEKAAQKYGSRTVVPMSKFIDDIFAYVLLPAMIGWYIAKHYIW